MRENAAAMAILVGDIGGTKTVLATAELEGDRVRLGMQLRYPSGEFASLQDIVERFLGETGMLCTSAAFAVAGPVHADRSRITNLPWEVDARSLEHTSRLESVRLLNDLEAVAWGIPALAPEDLHVLHAGERGAAGNACVVAAGTGLGEAGMFWDGRCHRPFATEGGHTDFAPSDEREYALLRHLQARYGRHVSWERVVSGLGIGNLYEFLRTRDPARGAGGLVEGAADEDVAAAVAAGASDGRCPVCIEAMDMFASLYGREAGNMALKHMALGGVYLGGGIAPKNLDLLHRPLFLDAFFDKGRMAALMRRMPVKVIMEQRAPLLGAARFAVEG